VAPELFAGVRVGGPGDWRVPGPQRLLAAPGDSVWARPRSEVHPRPGGGGGVRSPPFNNRSPTFGALVGLPSAFTGFVPVVGTGALDLPPRATGILDSLAVAGRPLPADARAAPS